MRSIVYHNCKVASCSSGGECGGGCEDKSVCDWEDKILSVFMVKKSAWREYLAGVYAGEFLAGVFEICEVLKNNLIVVVLICKVPKNNLVVVVQICKVPKNLQMLKKSLPSTVHQMRLSNQNIHIHNFLFLAVT
ncbi:hypothetical protein Tco_0632839 [Tanacetum coccineum]